MAKKTKSNKAERQDVPKSKKVKKALLKSGAVILSLATAVIGTYAILKFTLGDTNKTSAPGSDIADHRIVHELTEDEIRDNGINVVDETDLTNNGTHKGDAYYEQSVNINDPSVSENVNSNPHHKRGSNFDEDENSVPAPTVETEKSFEK